MNTLLSWLYPALWFLGGLTVTWVQGVVSYFIVHWLEDGFPELLVFLEVSLGCGILCLILAAIPYSLVPVIVCIGGTLAERALIPTDQSWGTGLMRMLSTITCSLVLFCLLMFFIESRGANTLPIFDIGGLMGALCSPAVFPIALWVWHSSQLRPSMEGHLEKDDA